jgi:RHS repeat-associated protein
MATATMPSEVQTFTYDTLGNLIALETNQQSNKGGGTVTKTREPLTSAKLIPGTITTPIVHKRPPPSSGSSNITEYLLDHQFNRAQKRTGTQRISYIKDFYELDATDERTLYITIGDKKVAQVVDGDVSYFVNDRMGSTAFVVDGSGTVQEELTYEPFGSEVSGTSQPDVARYSYTQQERDSESGLMNYGGRMYNPALRRFLQADPWMGDIRNPQSLNKYSYVMNNPLKYDDPTGEIPVDTVWDAGVTTYDVGRMGVNGLQIIGNELKYGWAKVTGNETMKMNALKGLERDTAQFKEAAIDTAADGAAFAIPYVPAGTTKVIRGADKVTSISNDTKKAIKSVEIDPKHLIADVDKTNNKK